MARQSDLEAELLPIESEIHRFLRNPEPEVLCVRGKWGVGKTFAWKKFLRTAIDEKRVALGTYSYVSLFGLTSIRDTKRAIFESQVFLNLEESPNAKTISRSLSKGLGLTRKSLPAFIQTIPLLRNAGEELANAAFALVHDQIVCLDDMERVGQGLRVKDVLGLVSFLKEEKRCKVAVLLNDQQMSEQDKRDFEEQLEKVVDVSIEFAPSPSESFSIAVSESFPLRSDLEEAVVKLGIANIRTIKRIERMASQALDVLAGLHDNVRKQALLTTVIGSWAKLHPSEAPPFEYLKTYNAFEVGFREHEGQLQEQERAWTNALQSAGYAATDDFDAALLDGISAGYLDNDRVRSAGEKIDADHARSTRGSAFSEAWRLYHDSFKVNDDVVLNAMLAAISREPDAISLVNINAAIRLFREMGRDDQASEIIKMYIDAHAGDRSFFDLSNHHLAGDVIDAELREAFAANYEAIVDNRDPVEVLRECARQHGWNREDAELIGKLTSDDFVTLFESLASKDTSSIVKRALTFGEPSTTPGKMISDLAADALRKIATKSPLNRRRVMGYGVDLELPQEATPESQATPPH